MGVRALSRTSDLAGVNPCFRDLAVTSKPRNHLAEQIQARPLRISYGISDEGEIMKISLDRLLGHMAWANQKTIEHLQTLPEESLKAFATNPEWFVGEIVHHIVDSADHYAFRISGKPALTQPGDPCIDDVNVIADLARLKEQAATVDAMLLECLTLDDVQIEFVNFEDKLVKRWRSTILSQAIHHATEHRAQIASALEAKGFTPVNLDDFDLWAYEKSTER